VFLIVFVWNLYKCNYWLIIELILRNAPCNSKVYITALTLYMLSLISIILKYPIRTAQ